MKFLISLIKKETGFQKQFLVDIFKHITEQLPTTKKATRLSCFFLIFKFVH